MGKVEHSGRVSWISPGQLEQTVKNHLERGSTKLCLRAVLGQFRTRKGSKLLLSERRGGKLSCFLFTRCRGKGTVGLLSVSMVIVQEVCGTSSSGWFLEQMHVHQEWCG